MDCYIAQVMYVKGIDKWMPTIDTKDGQTYTGNKYTNSNDAFVELYSMIQKLEVNLVPDPRKTSVALTADERKELWETKYKDLESR